MRPVSRVRYQGAGRPQQPVHRRLWALRRSVRSFCWKARGAWGLVRTSDARSWVKNKLNGRGVTDIAAAIRSVVQALAEVGVVRINRNIQKIQC